MSKTVDEKVVEMRFDNAQFERNVSTTMKTLDKFKEKLNLTGASKGLEQLNTQSKKFDMTGMTSAIDTVHAKFSALQVMGVTALANITNAAVNAGKRIVSALTIDPIKTGFNEYELKMGSVQTIMAGTGESLETVNKYLDELNKYSDQTIYSFSDMTRNIGKFTNAGVKLEDAVMAIKGISNEAAVSGANAEEASRAMYNFAQALSSGYVKLIDWKSIEMANMATKEFKEQLIESAVAAGTLKKQANGMYKTIEKGTVMNATKNFNDTLQEQWMTTEVLVNTLRKYADETTEIGKKAKNAATEIKTVKMLWDTLREAAQSGWAQTWEIIVGDFDEAKVFLTEVGNVLGDMIEASSKSRNELFKGWKDLGGREDLIDSLRNTAKGISSIIKPVKEAFREIFPKTTSKDLSDFTKALKELTARIAISDETAQKIKTTFKGVFSVINVGLTVVKQLASGMITVLGAFKGLTGGILTATSAFGKYLSRITETVKQSNVFGNIINSLSDFMVRLITALKDFLGGFGGALSNVIKTVVGSVAKAIGTIFTAISSAIKSGDAAKAMDLLNKGLVSLVLLKTKNFINFLGKGGTIFDTINRFVDSVKGIADGISGILGKVGSILQAWQQQLHAKTLFKIAAAIGILAVSLIALSGIDRQDLENALSAITVLFVNLSIALKVLAAGTLKSAAGKMTLVMGLAMSVLILASAMKKIAGLNTDELVRTVIAISLMVKVMSKAMTKLAVDSKMAIKGSAGIIALAIGVKILASACKDLAILDIDQLGKGLLGLLGVMTILWAFIKFTKTQDKALIKLGASVVLLASGIKILAGACQEFAKMDITQVGIALAAMGGALVEIWAFSKFSGNSKKLISSGIALNIVVLAIKGLVEPFERLSALPIDAVGRGLAALGGSLIFLVGAIGALTWIAEKGGFSGGINMVFASLSIEALVNLLDKMVAAFVGFSKLSWGGIIQSLVSIGFSLGILIGATKKLSAQGIANIIACALSLNVLARSVAILATIGLPGIAAGVLGFAGVFTVLGVAMKFMKPLIPTMFKVAGAIAAFSGSFVLLAVSMTALGVGLTTFITGLILAFAGFSQIGWDTIAKGLVGIAGAFIIIGVAAKLLAPMTLSIITLAGSVALFGLSCSAVGVGVSLIVSALATMAAVGKEGAQAAGEALKALIVNVLETIPVAVKQIGLAFIELLNILKNTIPLLGEIVKETVFMLVDVLVTCAPNIAEGIFSLITSALQLLVKYTPMIANLLFDFMIGVLNVLATRSPEFVAALMNFLGHFFDAVCEAFNKIDVDKLYKGIIAIGIISVALHLIAGLVKIIPQALLGVLAFGVLVAELGIVIAAVGLLAKIPGFKELVTEGGNILQLVGTAIGQFVGGIVGGFAKGATSTLPDVAKNLSSFMTNLEPFINGMKNVGLDIIGKTVLLAGALAIFSGAGFISSIMQFLTGGVGLPLLGIQLSAFMIGAQGFLEGVKNIDPKTMQNVSSLAQAILAITAANLLNNMSQFLSIFSGGNSLASFGLQIAMLGSGMRKFVDNLGTFSDDQVKTIDCACQALKSLSSAASEIPNSGGLAALFAGDNDIAVFGAKLPIVGACLNAMVKAMGTFSDGEIKTVECAATAIKTLSSAGAEIPNSGGIGALFAGDNDIAAFSIKLPILGACLAGFVGALGTFGEGEITKIDAASNAIKILSSAANEIPNSGGLVTLFTGDNDIAVFGVKLPLLGVCLKGFIDSIGTFGEDQIKTIGAAANAIKVMSSAASEIPNSGGLVTLFTGDNDIAMFGAKMPLVGACLAGFVKNLGTFDESKIKIAECAAKVISTMAKVTSDIPASGGLAQLFTGESDISMFAWKLPGVAKHLSGFISNIGEFTEDQVQTATYAAKTLSTLAGVQVPASGGLKQLFDGENDISQFAWKLPSVAVCLAAFVDKLSGFTETQVSVAKYAADSLSVLAGVQVPPTMGLKQLFEGQNDISLFAWKLPGVATNLSKFIENIGNFDENRVKTAKYAAEALAAIAGVQVPTTNGGLKKLFEGDNDISKFAGKFPGLGSSLKQFIENIGSYEPKNIEVIKLAVQSLSAMSELGKIDIKNAGGNLEEFGARMISFANKIKEFLEGMNGIDGEAIKSAIGKINELINMAKTIASENINSLKTFSESLGNIGKDSISAFVNAFKDQQPKTDASNAINDIIQEVINRAMGRKDDLVARANDLVNAVTSTVKSGKLTSEAGDAGKFFVQGFANGIRNNIYLARDAGSEVGRKALAAAKESIDSHSPSKETYKLGTFFDLGFVNGIKALSHRVFSASSEMGDEAKYGLARAISRISDIVENDMDSEPTIRPILDLSEVESGASKIGSMFNGPSLAVASNLGSISYGMNKRQNGNSNDDVVSAIDKLRNNLSGTGDTYNVNGVTYDDGSNVRDAVQTLVRAARVERRK